MIIKNSTIDDLNEITRLYEFARDYQKIKGAVVWPKFDNSLIEAEISNSQQWKIIIDNQLACVWATTFHDPRIWGERNNEPSLYIHRIATHPIFRGNNLVFEIITWATKYAREQQKKYIRMDTVGENKELINYYKKCGFDFLGLSVPEDTSGLPAHYHHATVSLFQLSLY